jgi:DNA-binding transcriptional regulator YiaG
MDHRELRRLRRRLELTQAELAAHLDVTPTTIARWERNEVTITPPMAKLIGLVCGPLAKTARRRKTTKAKGARRP